jgi:recombination protein RecT
MNATETTKAALVRKSEGGTMLDTIERSGPELERALIQTGIDLERFKRLAWTEIRRNPMLLECTVPSVIGAMLQCAQLGLEPGPLGHAYLVPFKKECTFIVGYKGMIELAYRSGRVRAIEAVAVYEGEVWSGMERTQTGVHFKHVELPVSQRGPEVCWYAYARLMTGGSVAKVVYPEDVERAFKQSPAGRAGKGPWVSDRPMMALKTAVRRLQPMLPQSPYLAAAVDVDERVVSSFDASGPELALDSPEDVSPDKETED